MVDYIEDLDYNILEVNGLTGFKILTGKYSGVIYTYSNILVEDVPDGQEAVLRFEFSVVDPVDLVNEEFFDYEFKTIIGDILMSVLSDKAEKNVEFEQIDFEESEF